MKTFHCSSSTFMPFLFYIIIVASTSQYAAAQQRSSQRQGYNLAKKLWEDNGPYKCTLGGVLKFWTDIKSNTFKECDRRHFLNQQRIESCKEGAATFVREKADSCATEDDCKRLGGKVFAASAVSEKFCSLVDIAVQPKEFFPPVCQRTANRECNIEGRLEIQKLANARKCGSVTLPLSEQQNLVLQSECREFVRDWSRQSLLPYP